MMINVEDLKSKITNNDIIKIIQILGGTINYEDDNTIITNTICHHGHKPKLYYYKDTDFNKSKHETTNIFHCYTECSSNFDIIELVQKNKDLSFVDAINWLYIQLGYDAHTYGFGQNINKINDWEFINGLTSKKRKYEIENLKEYDTKILNIFQNMFLQEWIDEGISIDSMLKYKISYSTLQQKIIIPHFDINNRLIGVRTRSTNDEEIELFGKYTPFKIWNMTYNHPTSQNLYGININKQTIMKKKKIMLVESEKSVLQCDTMFGEDNFTVALSGIAFSDTQRDIILSLGVNEVIIALDKQYENVNSEEALKWAKNIKEKIIDKISPYVTVTVLWDTEDLLIYKDSPTDQGKEVLLKLLDNKIYVGCD